MSSILLQNPKNPKVGPNWRVERVTLLEFSTSFLWQNIKKLKGDPLAEKIEKKSHNPKKNKGGSFSLARYCMEKKGKTRKKGKPF